MKLIIHRGTNQIGGCVTEIESDGYKIFIDFGEQLSGTKLVELRPIDGLTCGDVSKSALFFTHYHGDHIGKIADALPDLPIYVGKTALEIFKCLEEKLSYIPDPNKAEKHKKNLERIQTINTFEALHRITIGELPLRHWLSTILLLMPTCLLSRLITNEYFTRGFSRTWF